MIIIYKYIDEFHLGNRATHISIEEFKGVKYLSVVEGLIYLEHQPAELCDIKHRVSVLVVFLEQSHEVYFL